MKLHLVKKKWAVVLLPFFSFCFGMQSEETNAKAEWLQFCRTAIQRARVDGAACSLSLVDPYIHLSGPLFKGARDFVGIDKPCLRSVHNARERNGQRVKILKAQLAGEYKIHLMPADAQEMRETLQQLVVLLKTNSDFQNSMFGMKFHAGITNQMAHYQILQLITDARGNIAPLVVLYPARGKEHAQKVLDLMYETFPTCKGLGVAPRFNQKFTNFVYVSQGEGSEKGGNFDCYFDADCVYYRSDFEGATKDYRLQSPVKEPVYKRLKEDD